jgi:hypothetical protein
MHQECKSLACIVRVAQSNDNTKIDGRHIYVCLRLYSKPYGSFISNARGFHQILFYTKRRDKEWDTLAIPKEDERYSFPSSMLANHFVVDIA